MNLDKKSNYNFMKCIEELAELSLELIHAVNKPNKENFEKICDEIKDVEKYLSLIKKDCDRKI
jgi:hypothetical protein|tara:strand:- start:200 stop:388 length:189 start_codon:yes stop_codon:yes gene_type:complete